MPSTDKTLLGLSQWNGADRPKMADFNSDNQKIDLACRGVLTSLTEHLEGSLHPSADAQRSWNAAATHTGEGIATETGLHGLRYHGKKLEVNVGGVWESCTPQPPEYPVYGVRIDLQNTNPETAVVYTDDAVGMTPGGPAWDQTLLGQIRPCLLKNGGVSYYLKPEDYSLRDDGRLSDLTSGGAGDVMVEIPKMAYAIYREGDSLFVKITGNPEAAAADGRFCFGAHTRSSPGDRQKLYVGAYLGSVVGGSLRSLSGKTIFTNKTFPEFRAMARANGEGYDLLGFYSYMLLQCLYLIRYKSRNSQSALGRGCVRRIAGMLPTGGADAKGMFFGSQENDLQMKAFGIEDLWGNAFSFIDGVRTDESGIWTATGNFTTQTSAVWSMLGLQFIGAPSYISQVAGTNAAGFFPVQTGGQALLNWCDQGSCGASCRAYVGGEYFSGDAAGIFTMRMQMNDTHLSDLVGGRIMYL